ncbi:BTAD domain-containing putative transcriptional regulator [Paractinoplanes globisporus]|uniref:BTAD domain-containing putative transcriptional regulator n=1 Tax=Paractinoplanes globisporus TaxID=113565 RepID=A0ABW6WL73_9ACTN|nr:BTAD domain-containing putative transcriptional regulator [Actinoplanes globisporus]
MLIGKVLGPTEVDAGGRMVDLGGRLPRRLVTALLAAEGRPVAEATLAETIWEGSPPASFSSSLQVYASRLRRALGADRDALERYGDGYRLRTAGTDAARFASELARGRQLLADRPGDALRAFDAALALWRGDAYADLADAPTIAAARAALIDLRAVATEERLAALLAVGDAPGAVGALDSSVREEPYRERRWELLIVALYRSGRQADALAAARRVRALLADDLGIDPGPALQELEARLLAQDPALLLPAPPPTARTAAPLNRPLSHFLGRREELALLASLTPASRLVTLVGPGGAGKTRLAVEFAADSRPWFVRLADVGEPALVASAVADAAGVHAPTAGALAAALGDRPGLLVLDNCEHLVDAVADLTLTVLAACPSVRVLATSREPLGIDGETLLPVAPMPADDAIALLTDRITAIRPGWRPNEAESRQLARLASALDGIPLALELAAARCRVLGLGELLGMLDDRFPALGPVPRGTLAPHETLEAAVAWSFDLLSAPDRELLLRLWPFEGGFTLEAVDGDLAALSSLVARSVVVADTTVTPSRYRLLEIVRAFCRGRDPDPAASRAAHARWVRGLVERMAPELAGERSAHAIRVLNRELANLRTGISHDLAVAPERALRTAGLLDWFWYRGVHVVDGLRLLRGALAAAPDADPIDRARAWLGAGTLHFLSGEPEPVWEALRNGVDALAGVTDREGVALRGQAHYYESLLYTVMGDYERAAAQGREVMAIGHRIGHQRLVASGSEALGWALTSAGDLAEGSRLLSSAAETAEGIQQTWTAAMSRLFLARTLLRAGDPAAAAGVLRLAIRGFSEEDDIANVLTCLLTGALTLLRLGRHEDGATLAAGVRREVARRGLSIEPGDPLGSAALDEALAGREGRPDAGDLDQAALIALFADAVEEETAAAG